MVWAAFHSVGRVPVAIAAITTKSSFLLVVAAQAGMSRVPELAGALFDVVAIILLALIAARRARNHGQTAAHPHRP